MKKLLTLFSTLILSTSCSTFADSDLKPTALEGGKRGGTVTYNPNGIDSTIEARKEDSHEKIEKFCGSKKYKISKEETVTVDPTTGDSIATMGANQLRRIHFVCE